MDGPPLARRPSSLYRTDRARSWRPASVVARARPPSLADVRLGSFRYPELPLERGDARLEGVGLPDQVRDALVPVVVGVDPHPRGGLALLGQDPDRRRVQVVRGLRAVVARHDPGRVAAEVDGRGIVL